MKTILVLLVASSWLACSRDALTDQSDSPLQGAWQIVEPSEMVLMDVETHAWDFIEDGFFSAIIINPDHCAGIGGAWETRGGLLWITVEEKTFKATFSVDGDVLTLVDEETKETTRWRKINSPAIVSLGNQGHCKPTSKLEVDS